ncbi:efflux RND transporter permease subunit [Mangrovibacterium sp.]|uniref:efflux RND transporter permease subunit n=1 Tax=Mangrovibacterium sp. TaxID=1961364 RepID=UPI00356241F9
MLENILSKKAVLYFVFFALIVGGIMSFDALPKLEDPEIPIKAAVVTTVYPGASAEEVEKEVTDVLEKAIQRLENIDFLESKSTPGMSQITINIKSGVKTADLPQLWDHLRRKVNDTSSSLPQGAYAPIVNDDFGDVSGIFFAITNDGYDELEFRRKVNDIKQRLLGIKGVKRIEEYGATQEVINIKFNNDYFATIGINPGMFFQFFNDQGTLVNAGNVHTGDERIRLTIGNKFQSLEEIRNFEVKLPDGNRYRLGDIATIEREKQDPYYTKLKYNNKEAMSLALSMEKGGNILKLGEVIEAEMALIQQDLPVGIDMHPVFYQHVKVDESINNFLINLIESVLIVIVVLLIAMGFRAGLLIASGLLFTILATFILMNMVGVEIHRVSLAAIIIAMGMLVDNAIVVADGILIDLERGMNRSKAFLNTAKKSGTPLLGATLVAILAFMPLAFNTTGAGEFLRPLFYVLAISLFVSWILAMIQTPFMAQFFYREKKDGEENEKDHLASPFYQGIKKAVQFLLWHKSVTAAMVTVVFVATIWAFSFAKMDFFPVATSDQFLLEYRLPEGKDISAVEKDLSDIYQEISQWDEIDYIVTSMGATPARYTLMRPVASLSPSYGELIIALKDKEYDFDVRARLQDHVRENYPQAEARVRPYQAIGGDYKIEVKFSGPDDQVLRKLAVQAESIMKASENTDFVTNDWRNEEKILTPYYSQEKARGLMINRSDVANALAVASTGAPVGVFYDGEYQLPIMLKLDQTLNDDMSLLPTLPVWSANAASSVTLAQLTDSIEIQWNNSIVRRYDGQRAIKAQCEPKTDITATEVLAELRPAIDEIPLPTGYTREWLGEFKSSNEANAGLAENFPLAMLLMIIIVVALFNNFRQPIIIFMIMPLAFVGVAIGVLVTNTSFGFFSIVGTLGLLGMMIKNAVVLLDEINIQLEEGKNQLHAIVDATVSRVRPVVMASLTTILGMLPLLWDEMFSSMSIAIMFGLLFGTLITLLVVPVLYALFYRIDTRQLHHTEE